MASSYQSKVWKIDLPDGWKARGGAGADGELHTVWHAEGVGILNIFYHADLGAPPRGSTASGYSGTVPGYCGKVDYGSPNRSWTLLCGEHWIRVRYFASLLPEEWESSGVDKIVASLSGRIQQDAGPNDEERA
jgi:hypothetical protein